MMRKRDKEKFMSPEANSASTSSSSTTRTTKSYDVIQCGRITFAYLMTTFFDGSNSNNVKVLPTDNCLKSDSVLYRKWKHVCFLSWSTFFLYGVLMSTQLYVSSTPLCAIAPHGYGSFFSFASAAALSGFFFTFLMLLFRILHARPGKDRIPSIIALNVVLMGLLSTLNFVLFNWVGVCIDTLGVASPAMLWGEWFSNGPTILFLTVALTGKKDLSKTDLVIISSFFVCILCGFLPIIPQSRSLSIFWIVVSSIACLPVLSLPWQVSPPERDPAGDMENGASKQSSSSRRQKQQLSFAHWMTVVCPLFPINYFLAATKVIGPGESVGVYLLLTLLMKAFFAASLADVHTHALLDSRDDLDKERQANDARRAFLQYLFHEVRTPLNSLTMGIELLKTKDLLDATDQELLDMMTGASDGMSETLNNVLSMQKIEEGKMELIFVPFNLRSSVTKVFSAMSEAAAAKNLRLEKLVAADVPLLMLGDVFRVEHVISNLLSNAINFSPDGGAIQLNVGVAAAETGSNGGNCKSASSRRITVSISDAGPGIPAENRGKIFDGFFPQVPPEQGKGGSRLGLGLALSKQIVTLHGGSIGVDSIEGRGSTFFFTIPFGIPSDGSDGAQQEEQRQELEHPPTNTHHVNISLLEPLEPTDEDVSPTILVVDDVASNRKMLQALLKRNGATKVDTAENGLEAVQAALVDPQRYDIIFMDNFMPVMNGLEAVRKLREEGYPKLVVGVTGNVLVEDVVQYLSAGADLVMGKPVKLELLRRLLRHVKEQGALSRPGMLLSEAERGGNVVLTWQKKAV